MVLLSNACAKKEDAGPDSTANPDVSPYCAPSSLEKVASQTGVGLVFSPDPMSASGAKGLPANSTQLDQYRSEVKLSNLRGYGVLEGKYVDVRNLIGCDGRFGAFDAKQEFKYSHQDPRFQETMAYFYGAEFRAEQDLFGYLSSKDQVRIYAHCGNRDEAFYLRWSEKNGTVVHNDVCLGNSNQTEGASYADDAAVTVHEVQHGATVNAYSPTIEFNQFFYDEAGALNEAISDFMALTFLAPKVNEGMDPRLFSRWALGSFNPDRSGVRGANLCPMYDPTYPDCKSYPEFSNDLNYISYVYPDGMGWPYANNFDGPNYIKSIFDGYSYQEEIHNTGVLMVGALWDVYQALKKSRNDDHQAAHELSSKLVFETILHLPQPTVVRQSPITFPGFAQELVRSAQTLSLTASEMTAVQGALQKRGLVDAPQLPKDWASVGPGYSVTKGLRVYDHPTVLRNWLSTVFDGDPTFYVKQGITTGLNHQLDPGETVLLWFDIQNDSDVTAGGVYLTIRTTSPYVSFLMSNINNYTTEDEKETHVMYYKINGKKIVDALNSNEKDRKTRIGNSYFTTNTHYDENRRTGVWTRVDSQAPSGTEVVFKVQLQPANGPSTELEFKTVIR